MRLSNSFTTTSLSITELYRQIFVNNNNNNDKNGDPRK